MNPERKIDWVTTNDIVELVLKLYGVVWVVVVLRGVVVVEAAAIVAYFCPYVPCSVIV